MIASTETDRTELLLRASRRSLLIVLAMLLVAAATLIAHQIRPGSLLADWTARMPWFIPIAIVILGGVMATSMPRRPNDPDVKAMLSDEFRQANLARAQRVALVAAVVAQLPLGILCSSLPGRAAVIVMGTATVTVAMASLILSFLYFDRE